MGLPSSTDKPINSSSSSAETPIFGSSPRSPSLKSADSTNSPENLSRINQAATGGSKTNAGNSVFYTTRSAISPSGHDAKTDEATEKFLSSMASQVKRVLSSIKQGFVDAAVSIFRCFSSLFKRESKDKESASATSLSTHSPAEIEKNAIRSQVNQLSPDAKVFRMKAFVAFFDKSRLQQEGVFRTAGNMRNVKENLVPELLSSSFSTLPEAVKTEDAASLLKQFVEGCGLFTKGTPAFEHLAKAAGTQDIEEYKAAIKEMTPEQRELLEDLLFVCGQVVDNSESNKMDAKNVAICFGPRLIPPHQNDSLAEIGRLTTMGTKAMEFMIINRQDLKALITSIEKVDEYSSF